MFNIFSKKIDFCNKSELEILSYFRSDKWNTLGRINQVNLLQSIENINAVKQNRDTSKVIPVGGKEYFGQYNDVKNTIEINLDNRTKDGYKNNSYQILDSIYHEGNHAYQDVCVRENRIEMPQHTRDMCKIESLKVNENNKKNGEEIGSYYNYKKNIDYDKCICEIDSKNKAVNSVIKNSSLFSGDPEYNNYLSQKSKDLKQILSIDEKTMKKQQAEAVYQALQHGDIDITEHDRQIHTIWQTQQSEPSMEESRVLAEDIENEIKSNERFIERKQIGTFIYQKPEYCEPVADLKKEQKEDVFESEDLEEEQEQKHRR